MVVFKIANRGKLSVECVSVGNISCKCFFRLNYEFFFGFNTENFKIGKSRKYDEDRVIYEKIEFIFQKGLYQNGKANFSGGSRPSLIRASG